MGKSSFSEDSERGPGFWRKNWANVLGAGLSGMIVVWMLYVTRTSAEPTPRETTYQSIILAAASIFASWFIAKIHAQYSQDENLSSLGSQVAQGIFVLSSQVDTLRAWVTNQRDSGRMGAADDALDHIEQSLRSLKPLSVLALGGVRHFIGGPLRRYERLQAQIGELVDEQMQQSGDLSARIRQAETDLDPVAVEKLREEMKRTEESFDRKLTELTQELPVMVSSELGLQRLPCPYCNTNVPVKILSVPGSTAMCTCSRCGRAFNAHVGATGRAFSRALTGEDPLTVAQAVAPEERLVRNALRGTQSLLKPEEVEKLVSLVIRIDGDARQSDSKLSVKGLSVRLLDEANKENYPLGAQAKRFFSLIYHGRAFKFDAGTRPSLAAEYANVMDRGTILEAYTRSCLWRIWDQFVFSGGHASLVAEVLFGRTGTESMELATKGLDELLRVRGAVSSKPGMPSKTEVKTAGRPDALPTVMRIRDNVSPDH